MSSPLRMPLWNSMLDADMNVRYWGYVGRKFSAREKYIKIFLAVFSTTSAVASWAIWTYYAELWKALLSASAVIAIAIALPILNYSGLAGKAVDQKGKCTRLLSQHEILWAKNEYDLQLDIESEFSRIQEAIAQTTKDDATIPLDEKLRQTAYREVFALRTT